MAQDNSIPQKLWNVPSGVDAYFEGRQLRDQHEVSSRNAMIQDRQMKAMDRGDSEEALKQLAPAIVALQDGDVAGFEQLKQFGGKLGIDPGILGKYTATDMPQLKQVASQYIAANKGQGTDDIKEYQYAKGQGYGGTFSDWQVQNRRAGASTTSINMPKQVGKFEEKYGEQLANDYNEIQVAGRAAIEQSAKVQRLGALLEKSYTGKFGETIQDLKSIGKFLGMDFKGVAEGDAARAISNELALQIRNPNLGPGMPGALSERDITFLVSINPGLGLTKQGNKLLVDYWLRINRRKQEIANLARKYRVQNRGVFDEGFNQIAAQYAEANPLFSEVDYQDYSGAMATQPAESPVTKRELKWTPDKGIH